MRLKGLHDMKTHSSLARERRLISVARNLHRLGGSEKEKPIRPRMAAASLHRELFLENKVRLYQIEVVRDLIEEINQATAEGIPVAAHELERLTNKLVKLAG